MIRVILIFISFFFLTNTYAQESLRLNNPFNSPEAEFMESIWKEVAKRNNITLIIQKIPYKRSLINVNSGIDDADVARILDISKYYPNLVTVPESIYNLEIVALTNKVGLNIKKLEDLKPYHVGIIRGMKIAKLKMVDVNPKSLIEATDYNGLLNLLTKGRIDVAFVDKMGIIKEVLKSQTEDYYLKTSPLISVKLYMQLNKKFKKYVVLFEQTLRSIKNDGTYQKYFDKYINIDVSLKVKSVE